MPVEEKVKYRYVNMNNPFMFKAYMIAKEWYETYPWNEKAMPVCIIVKDDVILATAIAGNGNHAIDGYCVRNERPGSAYSDCKWCSEPMHAEQIAIDRLKVNAIGGDVYLYGHYKMCESCLRVLSMMGLENYFLLDGCDELFDRHNPKTVIGYPRQFTK